MSDEEDYPDSVPCTDCGTPLQLPGFILDRPPYCSDCADERWPSE